MSTTGFKGTINLTGRPKGAVNKTTAQTKKIIEKIVSKELKNIDSLLEQLEPKERLDAIIKLLPYVMPKNTHIEIDAPAGHQFQPITLTVIEEPLKIEPNEES